MRLIGKNFVAKMNVALTLGVMWASQALGQSALGSAQLKKEDVVFYSKVIFGAGVAYFFVKAILKFIEGSTEDGMKQAMIGLACLVLALYGGDIAVAVFGQFAK